MLGTLCGVRQQCVGVLFFHRGVPISAPKARPRSPRSSPRRRALTDFGERFSHMRSRAHLSGGVARVAALQRMGESSACMFRVPVPQTSLFHAEPPFCCGRRRRQCVQTEAKSSLALFCIAAMISDAKRIVGPNASRAKSGVFRQCREVVGFGTWRGPERGSVGQSACDFGEGGREQGRESSSWRACAWAKFRAALGHDG